MIEALPPPKKTPDLSKSLYDAAVIEAQERRAQYQKNAMAEPGWAEMEARVVSGELSPAQAELEFIREKRELRQEWKRKKSLEAIAKKYGVPYGDIKDCTDSEQVIREVTGVNARARERIEELEDELGKRDAPPLEVHPGLTAMGMLNVLNKATNDLAGKERGKLRKIATNPHTKSSARDKARMQLLQLNEHETRGKQGIPKARV